MIDLLWNAINHIPGHIIRDRTRIGDDNDSFQYALAFEDWEFRVYMYEFSETVYNTEDFREACDYFYNFGWYLNLNSLCYTRLDLDWWMKKAIADLIAYALTFLNSPRDLEERISTFIGTYFAKLGARVYQYYK